MPATYCAFSGGDVFQRGAGGASSLVSVPAIDSIIMPGGLAVYSDVTTQLADTIQYFLTFDDVVKYIWFGKGVGNITVNGIIFSDCNMDMPGVPAYYGAWQGLRGQTTSLIIGSTTFKCVVANCNLTLVPEPDLMAQFQMVFSVLDY